MKAINELSSFTRTLAITAALLMFFMILPLGLVSVLAASDLAYYISALFAIFAFGFSIILSIRQKHISITSVVVFMVGLLFLTSSIIEFGFHIFTQNMSILDQLEFSGVMRPQQVGRGLVEIGVGFVWILANFANTKRKGSTEKRFQKTRGNFPFCIGIFFILFGIYVLINGLLPLS